ncbi:MAG TPA: hypothetical protein VLG92_00495 [Candidatus Saccharimonadia bacterium]|nr:hypothetical protein [Candidatus Saccharimonadia bacterium]
MRLAKNKRLLHLSVATVTAASSLTMFGFNQTAHAAALGSVFVRFDRMAISTATTGTVCAKPASTATEAKVKVTFPTGYTLGAAGTFTVSTTNLSWPTGGTAWPSIATASTVSGQDVTFGSGDLTAGTLYCFNWTNSAAVTVTSSANPSNLGSVTTQTSTPTDIDTAQYATASITNDQIVVTATVPPAFSFALSGNTDALGTLNSSAVSASPTPRTVTVNTNAHNGWMVWAKDANTGLSSASASATIASTTPGTISTLSAGTEGYNTGVTSSITSGGAITVDPAFASGGVNYKGGGLDTSMRLLATGAGVADTAVLTMTNNVAIKASTAAASDYTDTITVVGAGLF